MQGETLSRHYDHIHHGHPILPAVGDQYNGKHVRYPLHSRLHNIRQTDVRHDRGVQRGPLPGRRSDGSQKHSSLER